LSIWAHERNIPGVAAQHDEVLPFVGPPATLPLWAGFAFLPFIVAAYLWRTALFAILAALLWFVAPVAGLRRTPMTLVGLAVAALGFGPVTSALALGQLALPAAAAAFAVVIASRLWMKSLATIVVCLQSNLAISLLPQLRKKRTAVPILCGAAVFIVLCLLTVGFHGIMHYFDVLRAHNVAERFDAIQITPDAILYGLGANGFFSGAIAVLIGVTAVAIWIRNIGRLRDPVAAFSLTCFLMPFVTAFFHEHDLAIVFAPAIVLVLRAPRPLLAVTLAGAMLCATDWLGLAQRPDGLVQTFLLVASFATALLALRREADESAILAAGLVLCGVVVAGVLAHINPLPIWPDGMHALPDTVASQKIAAVWHAEQSATGLFARNPFWALLRCASLAGSALLAYAVISWRSLADSKTLTPVPA
ncbi:MAG TPA: hypothetical protein VGR69_01995, partial [Candidatus Rubrimentiphilum sp.]|nr:hypothetical protein [Candidatus Rubrimentiphilum sp.]